MQELASYSPLLRIFKCLKSCPASSPLNTERLTCALPPEPLQGLLEGCSRSISRLSPCRGGWQAPTERAGLQLTLFTIMSNLDLLLFTLKVISQGFIGSKKQERLGKEMPQLCLIVCNDILTMKQYLTVLKFNNFKFNNFLNFFFSCTVSCSQGYFIVVSKLIF